MAAQTASKPGASSRARKRVEPKTPSPAPAKQVLLLAEHSSSAPVRRVPIRLHADRVHRVIVTGSFTNWSTNEVLMRLEGDGWWCAEIDLSPGCHEYRFIVDGAWANGPSPDGYVANPFGGCNCVLNVR